WCANGNGNICTDTSHPDYTLVIDGTGYTLVPGEGVDPNEVPNQGVGRYHTDEETFFFIEKRTTPVNERGTYWIVKTRDGTEYEFGHTLDAEQVLCHVDWLGNTVYRWRLNKIRDTHGNEIIFQYDEVRTSYYCERESYLSHIWYNQRDDQTWGTHIEFVRASRPANKDGDRDDFTHPLFFQYSYLNKVRVTHGGQLTREYRLAYSFHGNSRRLQSVTEHGADGSALPATTFEYGLYDNTASNWAGGKTYPYSRLTAVNNGYGGRIEVDYQRATGKADTYYHYRVGERRTLDGLGHTARRLYTYGDPCWDAPGPCDDGHYGWALKGYHWQAEEVRGYDGDVLRRTHSTFVLPWPLTGRVGEQEIRDGAWVVLRRTETSWGYDWVIPSTGGYHTGVVFFHPDQVVTTDYSGGESVSTQVEYRYDDYGNVTAEYHYGNDERSIHRGYYPNTTAWIVNKLAWENVYEGITGNAGGLALKTQTLNYYDGAGSYTTAPTKGDLTKVKRGLSGRGWVTTRYAYDRWGNRTDVWDALNHRTTTTYDSTYHLYPVRTRNALDQWSYTEYYGVNQSSACINAGYHFGAVCREYGPNGTATATRYTYDAFGRLTKVIRPYDTESLPTVERQYHDGPGFWTLTRRRETSGQAATLDVYAYFDGLGRSIQTRAEAGGGQYAVESSEYDGLGRVVRAYVPRLEAGATRTAPGGPHTTTAYDALSRVVQVTNPDGTATTYVYSVDRNDADADFAGGRQTVYEIDANGHFVRRSFDAYGRLETVSESFGTWPTWSNEARTRYAYDVLDNLTTVTDAAGNVTTMTYDDLALGRKTEMDDPDMGHWTYAYDPAGNLVRQTDARGQRVCFYYDELNRLKGKTYSSGSGSCPGDPGYGGYAVKYWYDEGGHGYGVG
ncbi:MAG: hypothetical protein DRI92_05920, partial [Aquificota bacterium]